MKSMFSKKIVRKTFFEKNVSKNVLVFEKNVFSAKNIPGVVTIKRYSLPGPPTMLDDRPLIVPRFQGRSRDDHVVAHFPFQIDHFDVPSNRPPLSTISNI